MADWFPEAIVDRGNDSGEYTDIGEPKGLLHTTEGKSYAGARGAYVANNSWPHATCTYETGTFRIFQHNPLSKPSRALRNETGGVQTNRDNVIQLEIVGTADRSKSASWGTQYVENFPTPYLDGIARWMRFVNANHGVPNRCTVTFKRYPESYGTGNGIRLSAAAWDAYSGWLGHQHAPENTHGDPGLIAITYLLDQAGGQPQEDDVNEEQDQLLRRIASAVVPFYEVADGRFQVRTHIQNELVENNARVKAIVEQAIATIDVAALAAAIVAELPPGAPIDQATVEAGVRTVIPEIVAATVAEIAS